MEASPLTFAQPLWFLALILVAGFGVLYFWSQRRSEALIEKIVAPRLRGQLAGAVSLARRAVRAALVLSALALIVVALARPQMGFLEQEVQTRGRDIIIAVDTSRSMLATDVTPTRLARAKLVAQDLLNLMPGDRVGLIAFAGGAFLQAPLTLDQAAVLASLDELDTNIIPKGGTDIAAAIDQAIEAFGKGEGKTRALIILTDGEELDADGIAAAKKAADLGITIYTVGIGSAEGSLIPIASEEGGTDFVRDPSTGKPVQSHLDDTRLKEIAAAGGGFYTPLSSDTARIIYDKGILPLETREAGTMSSRLPIERYQWPLSVGLVFLVFWMILGEKRRIPQVPRAALVALLLLAGAASSPAADGVLEYRAGNYDKALADFSQQLKTSPDSAKLEYNAGAAAYKTGNYPAAIDYFTKAILADDNKLREDASYNLANSLVRRGEGAKGNDEKKSDWKNAIQHYTEALNIDPKNKEAAENRDIVKKLLEDLEKKEKEEKDKKDQQNKKDDKQKQDQKDQKQQDQNKQDQQNQSQDQKDQKDQQQQDQQKQQGSNGQDQKDQQNKDQQNKDQQNKDQQNKDQSGQSGQDQKQDQDKSGNQQPTPTPSPSASPSPNGQNGNQSQPDKGDQKQNQSQGGGNQNSQPTPTPGQNGAQQQPTPQPTPGEKKQGDLKAAGGQDKKDDQSKAGQQGATAAQEAEEKDGVMSATQAKNLLNSLRSDEERVKMQQQQSEDTLKNW